MSDVVELTEAQQAAQDFAAAVVDLSTAARELLDGGLTRRAVVLLLHDYLGEASPGKRSINAVLDALPQLAEFHTDLAVPR